MRGFSLEHLGSDAFTWYDLRVFIRHVQADPTSALAIELLGFRPWTVEAQLLATIADNIALGNWQRAGKKTAPRPKPIERPGAKPSGQKIGRDALPMSRFNEWWDAT